MEAEAARWGTWEELLLGGAVLRHGAAAWDSVAAELRARTPCPHLFTPQECKSRYEGLLQRFAGSDAWFEELRKLRVAELRRELEKSEDSIGSLQSKIESLNAERGSNTSNNSAEYNTIQTEPTLPIKKSDGLDLSNKEISRDGSSAGSYTAETGRDWSQGCPISASISSHENDMKVEPPENSRKVIAQVVCRKKRGQRKRKDCTIVKDGSARKSSTTDLDIVEPPNPGCNLEVKTPQEDVKLPQEGVKPSHEDSGDHAERKGGSSNLAKIMDSIMEHKGASIFRYKLENQKKAKYKKMIRRHIDMQNICSRIDDGSISSEKELFRDLLLLANNVIAFYPKNLPEHKLGVKLREIVTKVLQEHCRNCNKNVAPVGVEECKPKKPQTLLACSGSKTGSAEVPKEAAGASLSGNGHKGGRVETPVGASARKKAVHGGRLSAGRTVDSDKKGGHVEASMGTTARKKGEVGAKIAGAPALETGKKAGSIEAPATPARKKGDIAGKVARGQTPKEASGVEVPVGSSPRKRAIGKTEKIGRETGKRQRESPTKVNKRARRR